MKPAGVLTPSFLCLLIAGAQQKPSQAEALSTAKTLYISTPEVSSLDLRGEIAKKVLKGGKLALVSSTSAQKTNSRARNSGVDSISTQLKVFNENKCSRVFFVDWPGRSANVAEISVPEKAGSDEKIFDLLKSKGRDVCL